MGTTETDVDEPYILNLFLKMLLQFLTKFPVETPNLNHSHYHIILISNAA